MKREPDRVASGADGFDAPDRQGRSLQPQRHAGHLLVRDTPGELIQPTAYSDGLPGNRPEPESVV